MSQRKPPGKKAPGFFSFVVWRQFFMVLAAPGMATVAMSQVPDTNFVVALIVSAAPALLHGQLWKWSYDWAGYGEPTVSRLRQGQILAGLAHLALVGWALYYVAIGDVPFDGSGFYFGLTIAGALAGVWETVRPAIELTHKPDPPAKTVVPAPDREAAPAASTRIATDDAGAERGDDPPTPPTAPTPGSEDPATAPTPEAP